MEDQKEVKTEEITKEEPKIEVLQDTPEELKQRLDNAKAENIRKQQEIQRLRDEVESKERSNLNPSFNPNDLTTWKDHELKACLKDPQYVSLHDQAEELLAKRRHQRFLNEEHENTLHMNTELERQQKYPETFDPTHPMAVKMNQNLYTYRLQNNPAGRLVAARLAQSEIMQSKAVAAGRKQEQDRQTDVKVSFQGEQRPAPQVSDKISLQELKKRAMEGDPTAKAEWFKLRGLFDSKNDTHSV